MNRNIEKGLILKLTFFPTCYGEEGALTSDAQLIPIPLSDRNSIP